MKKRHHFHTLPRISHFSRKPGSASNITLAQLRAARPQSPAQHATASRWRGLLASGGWFFPRTWLGFGPATGSVVLALVVACCGAGTYRQGTNERIDGKETDASNGNNLNGDGGDHKEQGEDDSGSDCGNDGNGGENDVAGGDQAGVSNGNEPDSPFRVSACGGFREQDKRSRVETDDSLSTIPYCDAEVVAWSFDQENGVLSIMNRRVLLNCCGDHSITTEMVGDSLRVSEIDAPQSGTDRCRCLCVFDFAAEISDVTETALSIEIVRTVTDSDEDPKSIYSAAIDLSVGAGTVVVDDTDADIWCEHD